MIEERGHTPKDDTPPATVSTPEDGMNLDHLDPSDAERLRARDALLLTMEGRRRRASPGGRTPQMPRRNIK